MKRTSRYAARIPTMVRNLLALYRRATPAEVEAGLLWYPDARRIVCDWAGTYRLHDRTVAQVIAAVSPQCEWPRNLVIADDILAGRPPSIGGALHVNIRKAERLRDNPSLTMLDVFPGGPKVCNFAVNLLGPDVTAVTIDGHAAQAAMNDATFTAGLPWRVYANFACAYHEAAHHVHADTADFQAIIWHVWKRLYPRQVKNRLRKGVSL